MRAYVHIGATKTGSTTLQTFFDMNREGLSAQGVRYWSTDAPAGSSMSVAIAALAGAGLGLQRKRARAKAGNPSVEDNLQRLAQFKAELASIAASATEAALLVSSEHFSVHQTDPESIRALDQLFRDSFERVEYIYYIRNQHDLALSQYSQRVKGGMAVTLDEMIGRSLDGLDHLKFVETWVDTVGPDRFHLRLTDPTALVNGDLCDDFCQLVGVDPAPLARPERRNESMSAAAIELARRVNAQMPAVVEGKKPNAARNALIKRIGAAGAGGRRLFLNPDQAARITAAVEAGNETLRARFFPDREVLFSASSAIKPADEAQATDAEALDLAVRLLVDGGTQGKVVAKAGEKPARLARREGPRPGARRKKKKAPRSVGTV